MKSPYDSFELIETMLFRHKIRFLDDHLDRLETSARHFNIDFERVGIERLLADFCKTIDLDLPHKVRMTVRTGGRISLTKSVIHREKFPSRKLCISEHRVNSASEFFYHKTTRRELYETEFERAQAGGFCEVLFFNEQDMLTEASRHNVFVRMERGIFTPPISSGLLPGIYRKQVLKRCKSIQEKDISRSELLDSQAIYICNAVRGLTRVHL